MTAADVTREVARQLAEEAAESIYAHEDAAAIWRLADALGMLVSLQTTPSIGSDADHPTGRGLYAGQVKR